MKSDKVFLEGVYEKAKDLQKDDCNLEPSVNKKTENNLIEFNHSRPFKKERKSTAAKRIYTKYLSIAAVFLLVVSMGVFQRLIKRENQSIKPQPHSLEQRNSRSFNPVLSLSEAATDIFEVKAVTKNQTTAYNLVKRYKGDKEEAVLKQIITADNVFEELSSGQTAVYFLQADKRKLLSIFYSSEKEPDVFINQTGESMTRGDLESIKENKGNMLQRK
jgi:hypothetical protein